MPSSVIRAFDYRPAQRELEILFTTGRRYVYFGVPSSVLSALRAAPRRARALFQRPHPRSISLRRAIGLAG